MHRLDSKHGLERLREFLSESDPGDYLLEDMDEWTRDGRLWVGVEGERWVAFGRIHDLGRGEGWLSGLRVGLSGRGQGRGGQLLNGLLSDARFIGLTELRAVIEDGNHPSQRLFARHGFRPVFEMTLRRATAGSGGDELLHPGTARDRLGGSIGWIPASSGQVDFFLPGRRVADSVGGTLASSTVGSRRASWTGVPDWPRQFKWTGCGSLGPCGSIRFRASRSLSFPQSRRSRKDWAGGVADVSTVHRTFEAGVCGPWIEPPR